MIGIVGAMEEEVSAICELMDIQNKKSQNGYVFYEGKMANKDVVVLQGGIGKVNAAIAMSLLFHLYDIDIVINIGSAGGLKMNQEVGDVVISTRVAHHDVDVTAFGRELGEVPGLPLYFEADQELLNQVDAILEESSLVHHKGLIVSGDQFISQPVQVQRIQDSFPDAMCAEMEAAAVAQACYVYNKRFIITRSLSDIFGKGDNDIQFDEYLKKASASSAKMCFELVKALH